MMKKCLAMLLALATVFSLTACVGNTPGSTQGTTAPVTTAPETVYSVKSPMAYPDYTFDHTPTTDELRQMAVKAMMDYLSVQWYTEEKITYNKSGAAGGKTYIHQAMTNYAGLPYTNGDKGLIQFLEYYDHETGKLLFDGSAVEFNQLIGGTCACGVMWSWSTVCDSLTGKFVNYNMVKKYGCIPVGDYTYDYNISDYSLDLSTETICKQNGKDVIFASYAKTLPADGLTSSPDNHAMMVIEPATVKYKPDGSIDGNRSYLMIADQRGGTAGDGNFYEKYENGETLHYSGRTSYKYTFNQLYDLWYLPVTTAEFAGLEPYKAPEVKFGLDTYAIVEELAQGEILSNFPICVLKINLVDADGNAQEIVNFQCDKIDVFMGLARKLPLKNYSSVLKTATLEKKMESGKSYTLKVDVTVSNGEKFTVAQLPMTKN